MDGGFPNDARTLGPVALGRLMPMHICVDAEGMITSVGPTLGKLWAGGGPSGQDLFQAIRIRRPHGIGDMAALHRHAGVRLHLALAGHDGPGLRGHALPLAAGEGMILNLSFGIAVAEAVARHGLTDADFAPTDLAVELLYLIEAKSAVMQELHGLNSRLHGAKIAAEEQALTDTLTGLRNRRALDAALDRAVAARLPFGLMHIDLDYFKQVNDTLGHAAGDHVLQTVARILRDETRSGDTVARVGGDEFVILFPGLTDPARLDAIARRMIERLSEPVPYGGRVCRISASIGMVISTAYDRPDPVCLLADADVALYQSKHAGRAQAHLHRPDARPTTG